MDKIKTYKILEKLSKLDVENQQRRLKNLLDGQTLIEEKIKNFQDTLEGERSFLRGNASSSHDFYAFEVVISSNIQKLKNRLAQLLGAIEGEKEVLLEFFSTQKKMDHVKDQEIARQKNNLNYQDEMFIQDLILMRGIKEHQA